ncbi:MAG: type II secretion system protein GspL [Pseudomonadota bacterium]
MLTLRLEFPEGVEALESGVVYWRVTHGQHNETIQDSGQLALRECNSELTLFKAYENKKTRLWWPSEYAVCVHTTVAPEQQRELMRVPRYEIEPHVAQDVDDMHVVATAPTSDSLLLLGIDKRMLSWVLERLSTAHLDPDTIGLDAEILAEDARQEEGGDHTVYAHQLGQRVLMYAKDQLIAACDSQHLAAYQEQIRALSYADNASTLSFLGDGQVDWWWDRATTATTQTNLRAGDFERQSLWTMVRQWRPVWMTAVAGCFLLAITHIVLIEIVKRQTSELRTEQAALYHSYFPNATQIFDPPAQLRSKLQRPNQPEISTDGLATYALFSDKLAQLSASERGPLKRVAFSAKQNELRVQITLSSIRTLESLVQTLEQHGLETHIESATAGNEGVAAQLSMKIIRLS